MIISAIAVPALANVNALSATAGWEATDLLRLFNARVTLSYSGGNGNWVRYFASAESNLGYFSEFSGFSQSVSLSSYGDWVSADYYVIPYVVDYSGYALYDSPW